MQSHGNDIDMISREKKSFKLPIQLMNRDLLTAISKCKINKSNKQLIQHF